MGRWLRPYVLVLVIIFIRPYAKCAEFAVEYTGKVYLHSPQNYTYALTRNNSSVAVRINISATNLSVDYPLITIIKQQANVLSFPLPLVISNRFSYHLVSRTLCPSFIALSGHYNKSEQIIVELSSFMPDESRAPSYHLRLDALDNFVLQLGHTTNLIITPSEPQYFLFSFPKDIHSVLVHVHSTDRLCMTVSVQAAKCPVADILDTVKFSGIYQTVTTLGAITVSKLEQNDTEFLIVLVLKPEDSDCGLSSPIIKPEGRSPNRVKNISIIVTPSLNGYHYYLPIFGAVGIYFVFYIATAVIILVYPSYDRHVRHYLKSFTRVSLHYDRRKPPDVFPSTRSTITCQIIPSSYTYLPSDEATTRARRVFDTSSSPAFVPETSSSTSADTPSHRSPHPPAPLSHGLFSSSSSSDLNDVGDDFIRLQSATRYKSRKFQHPQQTSLPTMRSNNKHHRRSMSYGSTREMSLNCVSGQVKRCSACSRINLDLERNIGASVTSSNVREFPPVQQINEGLVSHPNQTDTRKGRHVYSHTRVLFVSDLARKRYSTLDRKYLLYFWYLIIISIFYGLPVVQLVMTYQKALHDTGNEDICYYNFECAHPLGVFTAFNNIISNIGYVMLGLLFLGLTARRHLIHRRIKKFGVHFDQTHGIPQHYGLFYAMGLALTMEGLLSACYHVCPSFSNFQFDTAYMYILALILMLKIYQTRHPDINASAHSAYMVMAVVILAGVTGVLYGGETFWVLFTIVFLTMSVWLTAEIYYMGQWNFDICLPRRLYHLIRSDGIHCLTPKYMERMLLLLVANCVNIGMATFGLFTRPRDFSSFLLSIFMINLLMYYFFYVIMKCRFRERFHCIPLLYILLACVTWGSAIYFFIQHSTTWEVTPAQSRALNQPCIFLGFYDVHDVWHFLSSTSMFFSFMSIMTLDDDLINTPRNKIPVF